MKHATSFAVVFFLLSVFTSCQNDVERSKVGDEIRFAVSTGFSGKLSRTAYSGDVSSDNKYERIDWQVNDKIGIYCEQVSAPASKYAEYAISDVLTPADGSLVSQAHLVASSAGGGLCWGLNGLHTFYAVSPSPQASGATTSISSKTVRASIPGTQNTDLSAVSESEGNYEVAPNMKNMVLTAKAAFSPEPGVPDGGVFLTFTPLTTVIQFFLTNESGADLEMTSVSLISGEGKSSGAVLNGAFSVDLDTWSKPASVSPYEGCTVAYDSVYPACTGTETSTSLTDRTLSIRVGTNEEPLVLGEGKQLTFTFFLVPTHDFNDLTFKFTKPDGTSMSTYLGISEEQGIFFPHFKKSFVKGKLNHNGAEWTIKYNPSVVSWNSGAETDITPSPKVVESDVLTVVTSWDSGIDSVLNLGGNEADEFEWVDLGLPSKTLWANKNIGSNKVTDAGYYYSWGNTTAYKRNASNSAWEVAENGAAFEGGFTTTNYESTSGAALTESFKGKADNDAATAVYGHEFATPDKTAYDELLSACYWVKCDGETVKYRDSNVNGYIVYKRKTDDVSTIYDEATDGVEYTEADAHIFLPIGGYGNGDNIGEGGINGFLWTSTFSSANDAQSIKLHDDETDGSGYVKNLQNYRYYGFNIRAIKPGAHPVVKIGGIWWSTVNLGASKPTESGYYFTWGCVTPYKRSDGKWINVNTGKAYTFDAASYKSSSKYTGSNGTLPAQYDAATKLLGEEWKMPTKSDFKKLWEASYIVKSGSDYYFFPKDAEHGGGKLVKALPSGWTLSDALLVIHANGYASDNNISDSGTVWLWSSTNDNTITDKTKCFYLKADDSQSGYDANGWERTGFGIRPILK